MSVDNKDIENLRIDYSMDKLSEHDVFADPVRQFRKWFDHAIHSKCNEPNAMTLSTVCEDGSPNSRVVLLKGIEENAFRFYTNFNSTKGKEIALNNRVCLVFFWPELQRQVRIFGEAYKLDNKIAEHYFQSRPKGSQIGAWASNQSEIIADRNILTRKTEELESKYKQADILPKPDFWGGYFVKPFKIEFWQGRSSRLHDRILYTLIDIADFKWSISRLSP